MVNKYWIDAECDGLEIGAMVFSFVLVLLYHVLLIGGSSLLPKRFALGKNLYYRCSPSLHSFRPSSAPPPVKVNQIRLQCAWQIAVGRAVSSDGRAAAHRRRPDVP